MGLRPLPGQLVCPRLTGAWRHTAEDRHVWTGDAAVPAVPCGYAGGPHTLLCHLISTHRIPLERARGLLHDVPPPRSL